MRSRDNHGRMMLMLTSIVGVSMIFISFNCGGPWVDPFAVQYEIHCASCHGPDLEGTPQGAALVGADLKHGETVDELVRSIRNGYAESGMPPFSQLLTETEVRRIAILISEKRVGQGMDDLKINGSLKTPIGKIESEQVDFRLETMVTDLDPWPYSIAPLPDGQILLTEKMRGLSIISQDGVQSALIKGTPRVYVSNIKDAVGLVYGMGYILDVAIHPDYLNNGWIYLTYGDRCQNCNAIGRETNQDVSLCKLIRGRIEDGNWVDQETIWEADIETYTPGAETTVGGRICFDDAGHVFFSLGAKLFTPNPPGNIESYLGIQDLSLPYGKIYRIYDDGRIPEDNPYSSDTNALSSIWTYGHRSPQGLEVNPATGDLWGTEMGPRGGDEINLLLPGRNYGWPLYSKGINYDGSPVVFGDYLGITYNLGDIEQPVVDLTPSPAVSSFIFYDGAVFPEWQGDMIVGTLKATALYRVVLEGNKVMHREILLDDLARIRDIEMGVDGHVYLLLEHASGGQIVRLVRS